MRARVGDHHPRTTFHTVSEEEFCELQLYRILRGSQVSHSPKFRMAPALLLPVRAWPRSGTIHVERAPAGSDSPSSPRRGLGCERQRRAGRIQEGGDSQSLWVCEMV